MALDPKKVTAVLLADTWHAIEHGSFRIENLSSGTDHPVQVGGLIRLPHEVVWMEGGDEVRCTFDKVIALKLGK